MNTLDDIAREQPAPAANEEKKRKKKRNLLVGLAALAVIGGSAVCVGTGIVDKLKPGPEPQPTETVAVRVEPTNTAYAPLPTATAVTLSPTPTDPVEAYDVREAWYGNYDGTATGRATNWKTGYTGQFENDRLFLEILPSTFCTDYIRTIGTQPYCDEDTLWGADIMLAYTLPSSTEVVEILLYLPENLGDAPNLTITDSSLVITPTEEQPYELVLERVNGQLEGYLHTDGRLLEQWTEDAFGIPYLDHFSVESTTARSPFGTHSPKP